ncbi:MAG: hypothetical protein M2R45_04942 [Verrucomicrobia subdivision 3 bacterium]|nr:hypothetical protein [Limisphaerales bacterium]
MTTGIAKARFCFLLWVASALAAFRDLTQSRKHPAQEWTSANQSHSLRLETRRVRRSGNALPETGSHLDPPA